MSFSLRTTVSKQDMEYMKEAREILEGLLKELKANGWIRTGAQLRREKVALSQMMILMERASRHVQMANMLMLAFGKKHHRITRGLMDLRVGFTKLNAIDLMIYEIFGSFLECTELVLKGFLLAIVPKKPFRSNMTFGELIGALQRVCPNYGRRLAEQTDVVLRNAIAHGNYWPQAGNSGSVMLYCKNLGGIVCIESLDTVLDRMRKHNLLSICLNEVINRTGKQLHD